MRRAELDLEDLETTGQTRPARKAPALVIVNLMNPHSLCHRPTAWRQRADRHRTFAVRHPARRRRNSSSHRRTWSSSCRYGSLGVPPQLSADVYDGGIEAEVRLAEAERLTLAKTEADAKVHGDVVPLLEACSDGSHG
ncbi:hypothetical protein YWIDRAFT_03140 [Streptomyces sp. SceaMP-e96]|nr:hypothetical protein YWIDRAFT_03140 [Streptomyces sp. SceaMP-e96]